jgi:hypothetical protein
MRLEAAIQGNLERHMKAEVKAAGNAVVAGTRRAADGLKHEMRAQVTSAGLGRRLAARRRSWADRYRKLDKPDADHDQLVVPPDLQMPVSDWHRGNPK